MYEPILLKMRRVFDFVYPFANKLTLWSDNPLKTFK